MWLIIWLPRDYKVVLFFALHDCGSSIIHLVIDVYGNEISTSKMEVMYQTSNEASLCSYWKLGCVVCHWIFPPYAIAVDHFSSLKGCSSAQHQIHDCNSFKTDLQDSLEPMR